MKFTTALAVAMASFSTVVSAQTERDLDSHEHGSALLNVAIDDNSVSIELDSPWNNLVGFEHMPENSEQQTLLDDALALLNRPEQLFSLEGGDCVAADIVVDSSIGAEKEDKEHHDDEEHHDGEGSTHATVLVSYSFNCEDVTLLSAIDVHLLELWSGFEDLDVQLIGPGGQALEELNPQQTRLDIKQVQ